MPANLTHRYLNAEKAYRKASTLIEELECLNLMLRELPKHKGTDKLQAELKRKISRAKLALEKSSMASARSNLKIPRQGAGQVVIIGAPNSGKSQLMASLTGANSEVASYPYTTRSHLPGLMPWEDLFVQIIDTPPALSGVLSQDTLEIIRAADLVLILGDLGSDEGAEELLKILSEIQGGKTRLGCQSSIDRDQVGVTTTHTLLVWNKDDLLEANDRLDFFQETFKVADQALQRLITSISLFTISAATGHGVVGLTNGIIQVLDVVRVYTKHPLQKDPDYEKPYAVKRGTCLIEVAKLIHQDLARDFRSARVWGTQVHDGTTVKGDYVVHDKDIVEILTH
jgi:hypothetical protein